MPAGTVSVLSSFCLNASMARSRACPDSAVSAAGGVMNTWAPWVVTSYATTAASPAAP